MDENFALQTEHRATLILKAYSSLGNIEGRYFQIYLIS